MFKLTNELAGGWINQIQDPELRVFQRQIFGVVGQIGKPWVVPKQVVQLRPVWGDGKSLRLSFGFNEFLRKRKTAKTQNIRATNK